MGASEGALGLLDDHSAVQRALQLLGEHLGAVHGLLLQQSDGGDVGQGLDDRDLVGVQNPGMGAEQVQRPDHLVAQSQRDGVHGTESQACGMGSEGRPSLGGQR